MDGKMSEQPLKPGTKVTYMHYGQKKNGVVEGTSRDGSIVWIKDASWLHRASVVLA
jgi:hypothetical protein